MIKQLFLNLPQLGKSNWWVEITTAKPICIYYFGPFMSFQEADAMRPGYVEDLLQENSVIIQALVKQCQPTQLTIFHESDERVPTSLVS
ncbi:MAG: hypothetical protein RLZZ597_2454 [Cyanobacteriota bacterium]|jgi:hypothetical protein